MAFRASFYTLGCKVNAYESEAMAEQLKAGGFEIVPFAERADVCIVNTCTVTGIADRKSRQMLHKARELNPDAVIVCTGCYAEDAGELLKADHAADIVVGNTGKDRIAEVISEYLRSGKTDYTWKSVNLVKEYDSLTVSETMERTRAYVKIQDGCNQFCTYCMIPYVRGRVRSRTPDSILSEAARLSAAGFRELVLTGIHISSYGLDVEFPGENRQTPRADQAETNRRLLDLIHGIASVRGVERLRLGSLEPGIMTPEFVRSLSEVKSFCPQFHLSLQSGCRSTLERMGRRYTPKDYSRIVKDIHAVFPTAAVTTDIIAGFPGETESEFRETLDFVRQTDFAWIHVFKYSKRKGTKAADMPGQVPEYLKKARSRELIDLSREKKRNWLLSFKGKETEILFEEKAGISGWYQGHTKEAAEAAAFSEHSLSGGIYICRITGVRDDGTAEAEVLREKTIEYQPDTE